MVAYLTPFSRTIIHTSKSTYSNKTINEKYIMGRKLGSGSFSEVYLVTEKTTNIQYAMKIIERKRLRFSSKKEEQVDEIKK